MDYSQKTVEISFLAFLCLLKYFYQDQVVLTHKDHVTSRNLVRQQLIPVATFIYEVCSHTSDRSRQVARNVRSKSPAPHSSAEPVVAY